MAKGTLNKVILIGRVGADPRAFAGQPSVRLQPGGVGRGGPRLLHQDLREGQREGAECTAVGADTGDDDGDHDGGAGGILGRRESVCSTAGCEVASFGVVL